MSSPNSFGQLGLSILGLGTQYPPHALRPDAVDTLAKRYHNAESASMKKVLSINRFTGIDVSGSLARSGPGACPGLARSALLAKTLTARFRVGRLSETLTTPW